ncbi:MAG: DUF389 domain-containing protein [Bacteroidales bacterium]|nr:DUF389 domain-containing protein [Bacteroidales bacterium]
MNQEDKPRRRNPKALLVAVWRRFKSLLIIHDDTDIEATIASIRRSVEFRGINIWILFFAIIIASIGLNVNSTAVIIGAMLISPLMGPINGIGLAVGTFDMKLLQRSIRNLGIMVGISLLASTVYFILSPLSDAQSELLARTRPTIFDVLIATFGGLAGIVAASRKEQPFTVISGVAIATALMPPLCTAGFGLATLQFNYFFGAFYLFFINSFFIALATFLMVRYLKFPVNKFVDPKREKIVKRSIMFFTILVMIPSLFTAISVVKESAFNSQVIKFVNDLQKNDVLKDSQIISYDKLYDKKSPTLTLTIIGEEVSPAMMDTLRQIMLNDYSLSSTQLKVRQTSHIITGGDQADILAGLLVDREQQIREQEIEIASLKDSIQTGGPSKYAEVARTIGEKYHTTIEEIAITENTFFNPHTKKYQSVPTIYVKWHGPENAAVRSELSTWVPVLLGVEQVRIISE